MSCTGTGTFGHVVGNDGPVGAVKCCVVVGQLVISVLVDGGIDGKMWCGNVGDVVARDEKVGGGVELVVVGKDVVGGHVGCSEDGCPNRCSAGFEVAAGVVVELIEK